MYQLTILKNIPGIIHGFSEKSEGNTSFKWGKNKEEVIEYRKRFLNQLDIPLSSCVTMDLNHSLKIASVGKTDMGRGMGGENYIEADALVTNEPNVFLFLLTADCLPLILYDPVKKIVALAHISYINTSDRFSAKVVEYLAAECGSEPNDIIVGIGPAIHKESYVFPSETIKQREMRVPEWGKYLTDFPDGKTSVDIIGFNFEQLLEAGVLEGNIEVSEIDTASSSRFFSHYRSKRITGEPEGRMAIVIGMR
jgi:hypothetical protein